MLSLKDKRIFVSGAGAGMGRSIALLSAKAGAKVVATDKDVKVLSELNQENIETYVLDVTDNSAVEHFFKDQETFQGIVNMVGWVHHGQLHKVSEEDWRKSFLINVDSMFYVLRAVLPAMIAEGGGSIVNMGSLASSAKGFPYRAAYGASKAAVIGLTKSIAADHIRDGIRANAICPGTIETPSLAERIEALSLELGSVEKARAWFVDRQPMKRIGQPAEIAKLIIYLLSDDGAYATGQAYIIDGGTTT